MPNAPFSGPRLKIERANSHINDAAAHLSNFLGTRPYHLRVDRDPHTHQHYVRFQATKAPPAELPLIIGDAVHNLRGALDLFASEVVRRGNENDSSVHFPFHQTRENLVDTINKGQIKRIAPAVADAIVNDVRPYNDGNELLWSLNKLDALDKHRLLIPVAAVVALKNVSLEDERQSMVIRNMTLIVSCGRLVTPISTPRRLQIKEYGEADIDLFFGKGQPLEGKPVIPMLHQLAHVVAGVIETLASVYTQNRT